MLVLSCCLDLILLSHTQYIPPHPIHSKIPCYSYTSIKFLVSAQLPAHLLLLGEPWLMTIHNMQIAIRMHLGIPQISPHTRKEYLGLMIRPAKHPSK